MAGSVKQAVAHAVFRAFRGCLALGLYEGAGVCLALLTKKHNSGGDGVLCLSRSVFADDVLALAENGGSLTYYSFPKNLLRDFVRRFFPAGVEEATYHLSEYAEYRERLYRAVRRMMRAFLVLRPCRCVLSGNFGYLEQQELFRFFRDSGRLGAVLFKEGIALQNMQAPSSLAKVFAGKRFLADLALFYNEEIAAMMAGAGVPGLEPSKCRPVGVPRMDRYHGRKSLPERSLVLFSFYPEDKFKYFVPDAAIRRVLDGRAAEFHRAVVAFAVGNPEWSVVVKTKKSPHYLDYVRNLAQAETGGSLPANLTITADAPPRELLENASAVIGYNSTTLVESLAMGCRTIVPVFSDLLEDDSWEMFASHGTLVEQWREPGSLAGLLAEGGDGLRDDALLDAFLARTMYRRDGQASQRVEAVLSDAIKNMRKQEAS